MTEREVVLVAVVAAVAAAVAVGPPWWCAVAVALVAVRFRHVALVALVVGGVVGAAAARAEDGLIGPTGAVSGPATLVTDPVSEPGGVVVEVRFEGRRYRSFLTDEPARSAMGLRAGWAVAIAGTTGPLSGPWEWRAARHLSGRLRVSTLAPVDAGAWWWRAANWMHGTVEVGARSFDPDQRALFLGILFGDDREQDVVSQARFRASALSHLTAVSGSNVAFLLLVATPVLSRLRLRPRWCATVALLVWFALVTRLEPSVLRAVAMALVAATAFWWGRHTTGIRVLSVAIVGLLAVDPLLVWSMGFRLSVVACLALVVLAGPLERGLPGPRLLAAPLAVSLAAQAGTAPLLVGLAGSVPALGPVANLFAVPVAGAMMAWGVVAGPVAGLVGGPLATLLGLPSRWMAEWLMVVATVGADTRLPRLGPIGAVVSSVAVGVIGLVLRRRERTERPSRVWLVPFVCMVAVVVVVLDVTVVAARPMSVSARGVEMWASGDAVVLHLFGVADEADTITAVLRTRRSRVDVVVVTGGGMVSAHAVWCLREMTDVGVVLAADPAIIRDARPLPLGVVGVGDLWIDVSRARDGPWRVAVRGPEARG